MPTACCVLSTLNTLYAEVAITFGNGKSLAVVPTHPQDALQFWVTTAQRRCIKVLGLTSYSIPMLFYSSLTTILCKLFCCYSLGQHHYAIWIWCLRSLSPIKRLSCCFLSKPFWSSYCADRVCCQSSRPAWLEAFLMLCCMDCRPFNCCYMQISCSATTCHLEQPLLLCCLSAHCYSNTKGSYCSQEVNKSRRF